ncbi:MAG: FMN-binding glutamate synthase family protein [Planctomycetota bacterium]|nr:MAG: FMN-binding glutamate synthase family protein [Planctomycetota bacterium]
MLALKILGALLLAVVLYDLLQRKHAILRNFPVVGHLRYLLEAFGPELRQYVVTSNDEERPFSRDQRTWVYRSSKGLDSTVGFGTDNDVEGAPNYLIVKQRSFPAPEPPQGAARFDAEHGLPCAKVLGAARGRREAFRPRSVVNVSAMSYGSLSGVAIEALNKGVALAGCLHNTGEGGLSPHHQMGGELVWQIGTGYFGCRDAHGHFDLDRLVATVNAHPVRAIEIKISQGAKPGHGGLLPAAKVTPTIAAIRGIPVGRDCHSPPAHSAFGDVDEMLDFVERVAEATGRPVGIKSAVGEEVFWRELAREMQSGERGVDFITIDGGEGGTGAAPLAFSDHVALPFKLGMSRVYRQFAELGVHERVVFIGSGRLGFPETALLSFGLGCDMINLAREAMLAMGCIQAQRCHTGHCPTGIATQNRWLMRGLDPALKSVRVANYLSALRREVAALARAAGAVHPALIQLDDLEVLDGQFGGRSARDVFDYELGWGTPGREDREAIENLMRAPTVAG